MSLMGRARSNLVFLVLAVLCWGGALSAPAAAAESLGAVTGPVTEIVNGPVQEVVEALPPPVKETTETVTAPAQEAAQVPPPVKEVTETATAPVEAVKETVTPPVKETVAPPVKAVKETVAPPVKAVTETVAPPAKAVTETGRHASTAPPVSEGTRQAAQGTVESVTKTVLPTSKRASSSPGPAPTSSQVGSPRGHADQGSAAALSVDRTGRRPGNRFVPSPAIDGSTAAPVPKWLAYIWPAIALLRPGFTDLVDRWEAAVRVALATSAGFGEGPGTEPVVAGVHASGGSQGQADPTSPSSSSSSSSPFSKITSAVGGFPYNGAGAALAYIVIVGIMVLALYGAVRWEMARSRRGGRG
jgi:hypothetical protein